MSLPTWRDIWDVADVRELDNSRELTSYAIQSQYAASPRITGVAEIVQDRIDIKRSVDMFYRDVFNIYTARGYGLDVWGRIIGIGRVIEGPIDGDFFGFDGSGNPFNTFPFVPEIFLIPPTYITLADDDFRLLLLYKALANISSSDAATQNRLLATLVSTGIEGITARAYVLEVGVMVIRWVFEGVLTPTQKAIFKVAGTLARGAGVGWELYTLDPQATFGFAGSGLQPFNQAPFALYGGFIQHEEP